MTIERVVPAAERNPSINGFGIRGPSDDGMPWDAREVVRALRLEVSQLKVARDSNRRIGMAMGIVMRQLQVDESLAFDELRRISQNTNRKLREVAEDVIRDGRIQARCTVGDGQTVVDDQLNPLIHPQPQPAVTSLSGSSRGAPRGPAPGR